MILLLVGLWMIFRRKDQEDKGKTHYMFVYQLVDSLKGGIMLDKFGYVCMLLLTLTCLVKFVFILLIQNSVL